MRQFSWVYMSDEFYTILIKVVENYFGGTLDSSSMFKNRIFAYIKLAFYCYTVFINCY